MRSVLIGVACVVLVLGIWNVYMHLNRTKVVFVNITKLHEQYRLKKELEGKMKARVLAIKNIADSLQMIRNIQPRTGTYTSMDTNIARLRYEMQAVMDRGSEEMTVEVWNRLNPLIEKFGEKQGYSIVIGANGTGTVLYGKPEYDVTNELIRYVNAN